MGASVLMVALMGRFARITYRVGLCFIWTSALVMAFGIFVVRGGRNDVTTFGFLLIIGVMGLTVQYTWRWIVMRKKNNG